MTDADHMDHPADAELVSYLDGELTSTERSNLAHRLASSQDLQRRLLILAGGNRPFQKAFDSLLAQAPKERLEAMLSNLLSTPETSLSRPARLHRWMGMGALAAGILLFFAGVGADRVLPILSRDVHDLISIESQSSDDDWRQAVAEYLTLYTSETLASIPDDASMRERELAAIGSKLKLPLSSQKVMLSGLSFKRAQLLEYDGKPLGQISYLDPDSGPMALCIYPDNGRDATHHVEQRFGFNVVYWSKDGRHFMLIGRAPANRLQELADDLSNRLAG
ncbi:anti-sigma factor [Microvirga sp. 2TAF3]|uniref:anti-sigma factor n=1 Tax=Microvirga sp. 2TAF3 TaxID=3233014 RepID=UPI003F9D1998